MYTHIHCFVNCCKTHIVYIVYKPLFDSVLNGLLYTLSMAKQPQTVWVLWYQLCKRSFVFLALRFIAPPIGRCLGVKNRLNVSAAPSPTLESFYTQRSRRPTQVGLKSAPLDSYPVLFYPKGSSLSTPLYLRCSFKAFTSLLVVGQIMFWMKSTEEHGGCDGDTSLFLETLTSGKTQPYLQTYRHTEASLLPMDTLEMLPENDLYLLSLFLCI